jgi:hypothetical protein
LADGPIAAELPCARAPVTKIGQQLWAVPVRRRSVAEPRTWRAANTGGIAKAIAGDAAFVLAGHVGIDVSRDAAGTCLRCGRAEAFGLGHALCSVFRSRRSGPTLANTLQVFSAIRGEGAPIATKNAFRLTRLGYGGLGQWTDGARLLWNSVSNDFTVLKDAGVVYWIVASKRPPFRRPGASRARQGGHGACERPSKEPRLRLSVVRESHHSLTEELTSELTEIRS